MISISREDFDAVSFDVYRKILNWEPEISDFLGAWAERSGRAIARTELLEAYDRLRQPLQDERPAMRYPEVLRRTLQQMGAEFDVDVPESALETLAGLAAKHRAFDDSVDVLNSLRAMGLKLAALSNIDDRSFNEAVSARAAGRRRLGCCDYVPRTGRSRRVRKCLADQLTLCGPKPIFTFGDWRSVTAW
ncbi:MAG: hypothetical protein AAF882_22185 [Pseudomonadota bacterium]